MRAHTLLGRNHSWGNTAVTKGSLSHFTGDQLEWLSSEHPSQPAGTRLCQCFLCCFTFTWSLFISLNSTAQKLQLFGVHNVGVYWAHCYKKAALLSLRNEPDNHTPHLNTRTQAAELTFTSCPLTSTRMPWHMHTPMYKVHVKNITYCWAVVVHACNPNIL